MPTVTGVTVAEETFDEIELLPTVQTEVSNDANATVKPVATLEPSLDVAEIEKVEPYVLLPGSGKSIDWLADPKVKGTMSP